MCRCLVQVQVVCRAMESATFAIWFLRDYFDLVRKTAEKNRYNYSEETETVRAGLRDLVVKEISVGRMATICGGPRV